MFTTQGKCLRCSKALSLRLTKYEVAAAFWEGKDRELMNSKLKKAANANIAKDRTRKLKTGFPLPNNGTCKHYKKS